eukprot:464127_1
MGNCNKQQASRPKNDETFIIEFSKNHNVNAQSPQAMCHKRVIFISLIGLYLSYQQCEPHVLYSALLILPLKKEWIHSPSQYAAQLLYASSGLIRCDTASQELFKLIKWKDSQGLVFWAKDHLNNEKESADLVHPFWHFVSNKLVSMYDPITSQHYKPLILDTIALHKNKELCVVALNYERVKAIFNTSNPESFRVITSYHPFVSVYAQQQMDDDADSSVNNSEWWIISDYLFE